MNITIQANNFPNCQYADGDADLLFFVSETVKTADGEIITKSSYEDGGKWYLNIKCVIENGKLKVPEFILPSLTDSSKPGAKWKVFARRKHEQIDFFFASFQLFHGQPITNWQDIFEYNTAPISYEQNAKYPTFGQVVNLFNQNVAPDASQTVKGKSKLSQSGSDIAMSVNDPDLGQKFANISALAAGGLPKAGRTIASIKGYAADNDGGQGGFVWNATSTATEVAGMIVKPIGVTSGRWIRIHDSQLNVLWFGADPTGISDSTAAFNAALNYLAKTSPTNFSGWGTCKIRVPKGNFLINGTITRASPIGVCFVGEGQYATTLKRTNDTGIMFQLSTYINVTFSDMTMTHIPTNPDRNTWTNVLFALNGTGGGRNLVLERVTTLYFSKIINITNTVNADTTYCSKSSFYDCTTFYYSQNTQAILNKFEDCTWVGAIQKIFDVAGSMQTMVVNANIVIDGTILYFANVSGKYNLGTWTFINTCLEWTAAHAVANTVPKFIDAQGTFIYANVRSIDGKLRGGGVMPHAQARLCTLGTVAGLHITFEGGQYEGIWDFTNSTTNRPDRGSFVDLKNISLTSPSTWIFTDGGVSGAMFPQINFEHVMLGTGLPVNLTYARGGAPYYKPQRLIGVTRPDTSIRQYFAGTSVSMDLPFYGQEVLVDEVKFFLKANGSTGIKTISIYSNSARTTLIGTITIPASAAINKMYVSNIPADTIVTEGLFFTVDNTLGASTLQGQIYAKYTSV